MDLIILESQRNRTQNQKAAGTQEAFDKYMLSEQMTLFLQASQFGSPRTWYVPGRMKVR